MFPQILQFDNGPKKNRQRLQRFLSRIVKETGLLPSSMTIHDVKRKGSDPIAGGGFADVWRGTQGDLDVAMKVLRIFGERESSKQVLRVGSDNSSYPRSDHLLIMLVS